MGSKKLHAYDIGNGKLADTKCQVQDLETEFVSHSKIT